MGTAGDGHVEKEGSVAINVDTVFVVGDDH